MIDLDCEMPRRLSFRQCLGTAIECLACFGSDLALRFGLHRCRVYGASGAITSRSDCSFALPSASAAAAMQRARIVS